MLFAKRQRPLSLLERYPLLYRIYCYVNFGDSLWCNKLAKKKTSLLKWQAGLSSSVQCSTLVQNLSIPMLQHETMLVKSPTLTGYSSYSSLHVGVILYQNLLLFKAFNIKSDRQVFSVKKNVKSDQSEKNVNAHIRKVQSSTHGFY